MWVSLARKKKRRERRQTAAENAPKKAHRGFKERARPHAPILTDDRAPRGLIVKKKIKKVGIIAKEKSVNENDFQIKKIDKNSQNFLKKMISISQKPKEPTKKFKDPFKNVNFVINKEKICKERKQKRREIMKKTSGKGLKIANAEHNIISKLVRCN